jgi:hypothetical protein
MKNLIVLLVISMVVMTGCNSKKYQPKYKVEDIVGNYEVKLDIKDTSGYTSSEMLGFMLCEFEYKFKQDSVAMTSNIGAIKKTNVFYWNLKNDTIRITKPKGITVCAISDTTNGYILKAKKIHYILTKK